ncbi:chemerin-like receptor 1 [Salminus brasiliensis]|uniref:chemerin-like receptor 1 n=1 Tax=Salminus brasiliensis TaxID=930266 RepID=UPI003B8398EE
MDFNESVYEDYDDSVRAKVQSADVDAVFLNRIRMQYIVAYLIICTLGVILNTYVIIAGCHLYHNLQKSTSSVWVLALAVTHLVFSAFLVLQFLYAWNYFNWHYGAALCKLSSYVIYASMFSTAALLSLWSISSSRCFEGLWAKCGIRGISMVLILVTSSWTFGAVLSSPSLLSRELRYTELGEQCIDDYDLDKEKTTDFGRKNVTIVVLSRFLLGVLAPMFLMIASACIIQRQSGNMDGTCKRIACAIKVAYFVCWTPLLFMGVLQVTRGNSDFFRYGLPGATVLAAAHSFINPVIYLLVGHKLNMHWMKGVSYNTSGFAGANVPLHPMQV